MTPPNAPAPRVILDVLPNPVICLNGADEIVDANPAAERFFGLSRMLLVKKRLDELLPKGSPLTALVQQVRERGAGITEHNVELVSNRLINEQPQEQLTDIYAIPMPGVDNHLLVSLQERSRADKLTRQLNHRGAARSISAMAAILAHEIKNPLSGIRGAAQLLESDDEASKAMTALICDEVDRIVRLVERFEVFSESRPVPKQAINIHEALDHVRRLAISGFARHVHFIEEFDPSLPDVYGNWDQIVQVLLNLIKNAAEAIGEDAENGEIVLSTAYRAGVHVVMPNSGERISLPLEVCITDNGPGMPDHMIEHLFEPFMTTKSYGTGLGLATVAKIVSDHGGVIECERVKRGTKFRLLLPLYRETARGRS